jgi:uncharacterized membrane protein
MTSFIVGLLLFLGMHSISIIAPAWRDRTAARIGLGWRGIFAAVSVLGLILICRGYAAARLAPHIVYLPPNWARHITMTLMLPVFPMLLSSYFPGRIKTTLKHPMLAATKLWAVAHLISNGMLVDIILFGSFLLWAIADRISLKYRKERPINSAPPRSYNDVLAISGGLALYVIFVAWAHLALIGVSPI